MWGPGASCIWILMHHHICAGGSEGGAVEVKCAMHLTVDGEGGVETRFAEEVESDECMGY